MVSRFWHSIPVPDPLVHSERGKEATGLKRKRPTPNKKARRSLRVGRCALLAAVGLKRLLDLVSYLKCGFTPSPDSNNIGK
jgi:hypothetical protein